MIGTVLLDWRGLTHEGKAFTFSPENARILLSQSEPIRDFISDQAMALAGPALEVSGPGFRGTENLENRPEPTAIDTTALPIEPVADRIPSRADLPPPGGQIVYLEDYLLPGLDLLNHQSLEKRTAASLRELQRVQEMLHERFHSSGIAVSSIAIMREADAIRYEFALEKRLSSDDVVGLERSFTEILGADWIRIVPHLDNDTEISVNVSNAGRTDVSLEQVLMSEEWKAFTAVAQLPIALGRDTKGKALAADLSELPHLLIAGTTGSGKSACIDAVIASLLFQYSPDELRFIMIDMRFQMQIYGRLPHLLLPVLAEPRMALLGLRQLILEINRRYTIFARTGVRNIESFNRRQIDRSEELGHVNIADGLLIPDRMPFIVIIIDDLADLMGSAATDIESAITRITQCARATGVHLIISTQTPRADVITGAIKANIPCRIAFKVASRADSRVILDAKGAERLLGEGDLLYLHPSSPHCIRAQGAFVTDEELQRIMAFISDQVPDDFPVPVMTSVDEDVTDEDITDEDEEVIEKCLEIIRLEKRASTSLLQARLRLGYTRSARIIDILEQRGILGPGEGARPREILVDLDAGY
ncbi:MAG: DNA translocase FtsK [Chthoniobacterales bacterium]